MWKQQEYPEEEDKVNQSSNSGRTKTLHVFEEVVMTDNVGNKENMGRDPVNRIGVKKKKKKADLISGIREKPS